MSIEKQVAELTDAIIVNNKIGDRTNTLLEELANKGVKLIPLEGTIGESDDTASGESGAGDDKKEDKTAKNPESAKTGKGDSQNDGKDTPAEYDEKTFTATELRDFGNMFAVKLGALEDGDTAKNNFLARIKDVFTPLELGKMADTPDEVLPRLSAALQRDVFDYENEGQQEFENMAELAKKLTDEKNPL